MKISYEGKLSWNDKKSMQVSPIALFQDDNDLHNRLLFHPVQYTPWPPTQRLLGPSSQRQKSDHFLSLLSFSIISVTYRKWSPNRYNVHICHNANGDPNTSERGRRDLRFRAVYHTLVMIILYFNIPIIVLANSGPKINDKP